MDGGTIAAGIGAIATGAGGCIVVIHEFRRRDRKSLTAEVEELSADVSELRANLVVCRRYAYTLVEELARHGIDHPDPP